MLTREQRCDRLDDLIQRDLICRHVDFNGAEDHRQPGAVSLREALFPEWSRLYPVSSSDIFPSWFARLTDLFSKTSAAYWPEMVREYARVVRRAAVLTPEDWRQMDFAARAIALRIALAHARSVKPAVECVLALCERGAKGEVVSEEEWKSARATAYAVAEEAHRESLTIESYAGGIAGTAAVAPIAAPAAAPRDQREAILLSNAHDHADGATSFASCFAVNCVAEATVFAAREAIARVTWVTAAAVRDADADAPHSASATLPDVSSSASSCAWDIFTKAVLAAIDARCAVREASC